MIWKKDTLENKHHINFVTKSTKPRLIIEILGYDQIYKYWLYFILWNILSYAVLTFWDTCKQ